jgi:hypothetical protein
MCRPEFFAPDPAQLPDRLMEPATQPGQPPSAIATGVPLTASTTCPLHGLKMPMQDPGLQPGTCWYCAQAEAAERLAAGRDTIVITRDEILSVWREEHPGACSCPPGEVDKRCPQHGWPAAPEVIAPGAFDKHLPATVPVTYKGQPIGTAQVTATGGRVTSVTQPSGGAHAGITLHKRSLPDQLRYLARALGTGQASPEAAAMALYTLAEELEQ